MSFVKTLAALAAGVAATKGYERFRQGGGMAGLQKSMQDNPVLARYPEAKRMIEQFTEAASRGGESAQAGLAQLMSALGGAAATGATQATAMLDTLTGSTAATDRMEDQARLMIRAMVMAAKADGNISDEERRKIEAHLGDATPEERAFVEAELAAPVDVVGLARDTEADMRSQVYTAAASMCRGGSEAEAKYLSGLGGALRLDLEERKRLHASLGIAAPTV
jgi:uncharacterized membrane protein YebE (DUF533 family)